MTALLNRYGINLFGNRPLLLADQSVAPDEEIPRYPPFMKGLPAAPVERILATQVELINAIEHALSLPDDLYQTIAAPVIARYAAFSHLLPASESHHHRGAGGLFRHGLEVAHWATQAAQGCLFATQSTPRERKELELRWRLAVCFAGLLHDIGKPVSDMAVVDRHGEYTWNPCDENLTDWATQNGIDRYFLRWRENRHKRHEQFSALVLERVLTRASRTYLLAPGPDIMQAMLETIHGLDRGAKLYELVMAADCKSVERDLKAHTHTVDSAMGMPVEKYLFDAMRRLIKSGHWQANEKGARLWRFKEGLHIVWRTGAQDIVDTLTRDKVPGIPRDEDTLADILIERGLAIPKIMPDGRQYRYWRMQPQGLEVTLYMLRLASAELIFTNEPPVVVEGIEIEDLPEIAVSADSVQNSTPLESQPDVKINKLSRPQGNPQGCATTDQHLIPDDQEQSTNDQSSHKKLLPLTITQPTNVDAESSPPVTKFIAATDIAKKSKRTNTPSKPEAINEQALTTHTSQADSIDSAGNWLQAHGLAGTWLIQLASEINAERLLLGIDLLEAQDQYLLPFPDTAQKLNIEPNLFIKTLEDTGWLVTDVLSPMRKIQMINQVRGVLLATAPSGFMKQLLTVSSTSVAPSMQKPKDLNATVAKNNKVTLLTASKTEQAVKPQKLKLSPAANMQEPANKRQAIADSVTHSSPSTLVGSPAVMALINYLRTTRPISEAITADKLWHSVAESEITQFLKQQPRLKRSAFLREMANHPDCHIDETGIKVRITL